MATSSSSFDGIEIILVKWLNTLNICKRITNFKDFADGKIFLHLAEIIKGSNQVTPKSQDPSEESNDAFIISKRYDFVKSVLNEHFKLESAKIIDYEALVRSDNNEVAKLAILLLTAVVLFHIVHQMNKHILNPLFNLPPHIQTFIQDWLEIMLTIENEAQLHDSLSSVVENRGSTQSYESPVRLPRKRTSSKELPPINSPLRELINSTDIKYKIALRDKKKEINYLKMCLQEKSEKVVEMRVTNNSLKTVISEKDKEIKELKNDIGFLTPFRELLESSEGQQLELKEKITFLEERFKRCPTCIEYLEKMNSMTEDQAKILAENANLKKEINFLQNEHNDLNKNANDYAATMEKEHTKKINECHVQIEKLKFTSNLYQAIHQKLAASIRSKPNVTTPEEMSDETSMISGNGLLNNEFGVSSCPNETHHSLRNSQLQKNAESVKMLSNFVPQVRYDLRDGTLPLPKTMVDFWPVICEELLWAISGDTNLSNLEEKVHLCLKDYFVFTGRPYPGKNDLGPIYGFQWRHFGAEYKGFDADYNEQGVDQFARLIKAIKENPTDRRIILCSWNAADLPKMAVQPSHCLMQFYVSDGELSCCLVQGSGDVNADIPFNVVSYSLLTHMLAHVTNLKPGEFVHTVSGTYLPNKEIENYKKQAKSEFGTFPKLRINSKVKNIDEFKFADFELTNLCSDPLSSEFLSNISEICKMNGSGDVQNGIKFRSHDEYQYLNQVKYILNCGNTRKDRTGTGTKSKFATQARYSLRDGTFPLLTTKKVFWRGICEELIWFISGSTDANVLKEKNVHIWDGHSSKEYLASIGLEYPEEGDLGPVYGFQWRHFGARYTHMNADYSGQGVDQLANLINSLKTGAADKSVVICSWNVSDIPKMALPPCHCLMLFDVHNGELNCSLYQRSADMGLGVPFNIASYSLLTIMLAHVTNLKPGEFIHNIGDTHVYLDHVDALTEQVQREPRPFPKLRITSQVEKIEDFKFKDFELVDYNPHPAIKMAMSV